MVASNFKASLALVLQSEGGNDDDPADHGGRTSRGITQREFDAWRAENKNPLMDVWSASQADINAIYREEYWDPFCDGLPKGLDYLYFDMAVNAGPNRAAILLQRALKVTDDGPDRAGHSAGHCQGQPGAARHGFLGSKRSLLSKFAPAQVPEGLAQSCGVHEAKRHQDVRRRVTASRNQMENTVTSQNIQQLCPDRTLLVVRRARIPRDGSS
jgi:hypothetical protein